MGCMTKDLLTETPDSMDEVMNGLFKKKVKK